MCRMFFTKAITVGSLIFLLILLFSSCTSSQEGDPTTKNKRKRDRREYSIGIIIEDINNPYSLEMSKSFASYVESKQEKNLKLDIVETKKSHEDTFAQIERLLATPVDLIAVQLNYTDNLHISNIITMVKDSNIPLVFLNNIPALAEKYNNITTITFDNQEIGRLQAQYLIDIVEKNNLEGINIGIITGVLGSQSQKNRTNSFVSYTEESNDKINIVYSQTANSNKSDAYQLANIWLDSGNIDVIVCNDDIMALGAMIAIREHKQSNDIVLIGAGASNDTLKAIKRGHLDASIYFDFDKLAEETIAISKQIIDKVPTEKQHRVHVELVDTNNINEYLKEN